MSEMFTKIGGYIASGDPLVYADSATMTGDGTVASPFGVNKTDMFVQSPLFTGTSGEGSATSAYIGFSGYNETVLYSGDLTANATAALSDNWQNFEYIRVYGYSGPGGSMYGEGLTDAMIAASSDGNWNPDIGMTTVASWNHRTNFNIMATLPIVFDDTTSVSAMNGRLMGYWNGEWQFSDAETRSHCMKIVGINRKPEA